MTFKEVCAEIAASGASPEMKAAMERIVKIQQGIEKGIQQGVLKVAQSMKALGMPVETILEVTGLTQEQVSKLNASD